MAAQRGVRVVGLCPGARLGRVVRALLLLLWFAARGGALYFHIGETEKKCFIEEIPDETMVIGTREGREFSIRPRSWGGVGCGRVISELGAGVLGVPWRPRTQRHLAFL